MHFYVPRKTKDQQGIVSLIVTVILMMVISLIVISFARSSRREQRDSFDRQLSTNAFYAAESGINAARNAIAANPSLLDNSYTSACTGGGSFASAASMAVPSAPIGSTGSNATYTCIFVQPTVGDIQHDSSSGEPYAFKLQKSGGGSLGVLQFYWDAGGGGSYGGCPDAGKNPLSWPGNCASGVLRLELTDLTNNWVYFIYPDKGGGVGAWSTIPYGTTTGSVMTTRCTGGATPKECMFKLDLNAITTPLYARVSGLYKPYNLTVKPAAPGVEFVGAQVAVDATGKAGDVLRRIQIRYNANQFGGPAFAVQSGSSMCKRFTVDGVSVEDHANPLCWSGANPRTGAASLP